METAQKKAMKCIPFVIVGMLYAVVLYMQKDSMLANSDITFLVNRAVQMLDCIKDGHVPFFYYRDFGGVGYGSAFFYGHLTLYPFLPVLAIGGKIAFVYVYIAVMYVIAFTGVRQVASRFTNNSNFISVIFMGSTLMFEIVCMVRMQANNMGMALAYWYIAFAIDLFRNRDREKRNSIFKAAIVFFLIINTHLLTAFICFCFTVVIMIYYFDKLSIVRYLKFAVLTVAMCSYFVANFLYHAAQINDISNINNFVLKSLSVYDFNAPYIGSLEYSVITGKFAGLAIMDVITTIILIIFIIKGWKTKKIKLKLLQIFAIAGIIIGFNPIWKWLNLKIVMLPLQFSFRYIVYLMLFFYIFAFGKVNHDFKLFMQWYTVLYLAVFIASFGFGEKVNEYKQLDGQIGNGEYVSERFICNENEFLEMSTEVTDDTGRKYKYKTDGRSVSVKVKNGQQQIRLTIPKLYYKGYRAFLDGKKLRVTEGKSQFVCVEVPSGAHGTIKVYYKHPIWLIVWDGFCLVLVIFITAIVRKGEKYGKDKEGSNKVTKL